jgi:hypothetical protein
MLDQGVVLGVIEHLSLIMKVFYQGVVLEL